MKRLRWVLMLWIIFGIGSASAAERLQKLQPLQTGPTFTAYVYAITFQLPPGLFYCPWKQDQIGVVQHGFDVLIERPKFCLENKSGLINTIPENIPYISVFYSYWMGSDEPPPPPCHVVDRIRFLGHLHHLCKTLADGFVDIWVDGRFDATPEADARFDVFTSADRLPVDLKRFEAMVKSARTCTVTVSGNKHTPKFTVGVGPACPDDTSGLPQ